ncbi:MAG: hypothetical protein NT069_24975, partial [Planctomycetota bacterium]|nr:hypothetical protein [Planctomycetota bacterium]
MTIQTTIESFQTVRKGVISHQGRCHPPAVSRRGALHAGLLGLGGMSLATLLRQRAEAGETLPKDTAVIFL